MAEIDANTVGFINRQRVGRLATADRHGRPSVIPVCYAFDGRFIYSALDEKPKAASPLRLKRVRNIEENPNVALVIDEYSEDWSKLVFVLVSGLAEIIDPSRNADEHAGAVDLLRKKYPQYRAMRIDTRPMIKICPVRFTQWSGGPAEGETRE
jgi:PPOX class probable F420-dependent enzyme